MLCSKAKISWYECNNELINSIIRCGGTMKHLIFMIILTSFVFIFTCNRMTEEVYPKIDMHMHARTSAVRGPDGVPVPIPSIPMGSESKPTIVKTDEDVMGLALDAMNRNNIVLGVVTDAKLDRVYQWADADPGRFLAGPAIFSPAKADISFLRSEFKAGRLQVMGEIAAQYKGIPPNDPSLEPFFALAEALNVPTLIHCEGIAGPSSNFRLSLGNPLLLEDVLIKHPKLRLWVENAAYPYLEGIIALMYRYPQVYADLSTITWLIPRKEFWHYLKALIDADLGSRLMWGSDQMNWPGSIDIAVESIEEAPFLSEEQKRDIFYNNAVKFLKLNSLSSDR